jgi:hypothetical protein
MPLINTRTHKSLPVIFLLIVGCLVSLVSLVSLAQDNSNTERAAIEIISIEQRDPLFVRAQLMSSLDRRGNIGVVDNKLIIASTAGNLQQLKSIIADIDVPARRLVVSVDFEYGNLRTDNSGQQSTQALEGDVIRFADTIAPDPSLPQAQLVINSTVSAAGVESEVEIFNVAGFSGSHLLNLVLGQWYVINPLTDFETPTNTLSATEVVEEFAIAQTEQLLSATNPDITQPTARAAALAIRVDVLP